MTGDNVIKAGRKNCDKSAAKVAVVICNGKISDYDFAGQVVQKSDVVICADGGASHLKNMGMLPDVLIGDFDSIDANELEDMIRLGVRVMKYPKEKDYTDTEICVDYALENNFSKIIILGGIGTRFDHTLANVYLLKKIYEKKACGVIADEYNEIMIAGSRIEINRNTEMCGIENSRKNKLTILPFSDRVEGLTTSGLLYQLDNVNIDMGWTTGVSNEFTCDTAVLTLKKGLIIVIRSRD